MATSDALPIPIKGVAFRLYFGLYTAAGARITSWTGMDSEISKDGGAFTDCTNEATENGTTGRGYIDLTASEMDADHVFLSVYVTNSGFALATGDFHIYPAVSTGLEIPVDAQAISGGTTKPGYLDAAITSRAAASTALSTSQWTNARAALLDYLDAAISSRAADGAEVTVSSPVAQNGDVSVRQNRDYVSAIDTQITWTLTNPPGTTPSVVTFTCRKLEFSKACSYAAGVVTLQLTAAETGAMGVGEYAFEVEATISGYAHPGLVEGRLTVERDV